MSQPVSTRTTLHRYAHRAAYDRPPIEVALEDPAPRFDIDPPDYVVNYERERPSHG